MKHAWCGGGGGGGHDTQDFHIFSAGSLTYLIARLTCQAMGLGRCDRTRLEINMPETFH